MQSKSKTIPMVILFGKCIKTDALNQNYLRKMFESKKCEFRTALVLLLFDIFPAMTLKLPNNL